MCSSDLTTSANFDPHKWGKIFLHKAVGEIKVQVRTGYVRFALLCHCEIFRVSSQYFGEKLSSEKAALKRELFLSHFSPH